MKDRTDCYLGDIINPYRNQFRSKFPSQEGIYVVFIKNIGTGFHTLPSLRFLNLQVLFESLCNDIFVLSPMIMCLAPIEQ